MSFSMVLTPVLGLDKLQSVLTVCLSVPHAVRVSPTTHERTPQSERTRAMRLRLMEATIDCLVEYGWAGTTTTIVSRRAGVSRGAQLHHFPSKLDLVVASVEHLMARRGEEIEHIADGLSEGARTRATLDVLAQMFDSPVFFAALELWVAARSDEELRATVAPLERRIGRRTHEQAVVLFGVDESRGRNRQLIQATLDLMRGLGLASSLSDDTARRAGILDAWALTLDDQLEFS